MSFLTGFIILCDINYHTRVAVNQWLNVRLEIEGALVRASLEVLGYVIYPMHSTDSIQHWLEPR